MVKFTWEMDVALANEVKKHKPMYDPRHESFHNNCIRYKFWEKISKNLGLPVADCKKRWKNLRDQYCKKKKIGIKRWESSGPDSDYMKLLSFLSESAECEMLTDDISRLKNQPVKVEDTEHVSDDEFEPRDYQEESRNSEDTVTFKRHATEANSLEPVAKMTVTDANGLRSHICMENKTATHKFFESMADVVEKLPPQLQAQIRLKVCQIVTDMEIQHHSQDASDPLH